MVNNKSVFWQALIFTAIVFGIGLLLGFALENNRTSLIKNTLVQSELNILDQQIRNTELDSMNLSCSIATASTFNFADSIYDEAVQLERYDSVSKFTSDLKTLHKRYDLLRTMVWLEGIKIKSRCPNEFHTVIYLYEYDTQDLTVRAEQSAISRVLMELKNKHGTDVLLLPIAGNTNLESMNTIKNHYKIKKLPVIIVDESTVIDELPTVEELESTIFQSHK
jgi:hypothetical protein